MVIENFAESIADALEKYNPLIFRLHNSSEKEISYLMGKIEKAKKYRGYDYELVRMKLNGDDVSKSELLEKAVSMQGGRRTVLGLMDFKSHFGVWLRDDRIYDVDLGGFFKSID